MSKIAVLGAGAFGTALALYLYRLGHEVRVWAFDRDLPETVRNAGENFVYLPGFPIPGAIPFSNDFSETLAGVEIVIFVTPSAHLRKVSKSAQPFIPSDAFLVSTAKGIENESLGLMSEILEEVLPTHKNRTAFLSGPSFAKEIAQGLPADVALAAHDIEVARNIQKLLHSPAFRVYTSDDVVGVELGGALKNVIAVACGASDGLGAGTSARASLMTRGLAEITRLGVAKGANPLTFLGLAGVGDLILTCTGDLSRNRQFGLRLAGGEKPEDILKTQKAVAEGYVSARPVYRLAAKHGVEMPISEAVYKVLYADENLLTTAHALLQRERKDELTGIFFKSAPPKTGL